MPNITDVSTSNENLIMTADFPRLSPNALFDHLTQPDLLVKWWPQTAETDLKVGGRYHLGWPAMNWDLIGKYSALEPGKYIAYTWTWDHEPTLPTRKVTFSIEPDNAGSKLTLTHGDYTKNEIDQKDRQSHGDGWLYFLNQLQNL